MYCENNTERLFLILL